MISSLFTYSVDSAPSDVQLELIDLQSDTVLSDHVRYRSSLTDDHLSSVLHISTSDIQPDFSALVQALHILDFSH